MKNKIDKILFDNMASAGRRFYGLEVVIDSEKCVGCGICAIECPSRIIDMVQTSCKQQVSACEKECLCENDVKYALYQLQQGMGEETAFYTITEKNPFPAITGRICNHPCETGCNRGHLDQAVNLHGFEKYIGDSAVLKQLAFSAADEKKSKRIGVAGSGPAGLSCAFFLAKAGYDVTVYEKEDKPGGVLRYGIPKYRIPEETLDAEIDRALAVGIHVKTNVNVGKDVNLEDLIKEHDAVYLACGRQNNFKLNVVGEEYAIPALDFLKQSHQDHSQCLKGEAVVVGGGNVALDAARTAKRSGADSVTVISLEKAHEMPASSEEIGAAKDEGIRFICGMGVAILEKLNGRICVSLKNCTGLRDESGRFNPQYTPSDKKIITDTVITAIGQGADLKWLPTDIAAEHDRLVPVDDEKQTHRPGVFAGGDFTAFCHAGTVSGSITDGRKAAEQIRRYLGEEVQAGSGHRIEDTDHTEKYYAMKVRAEIAAEDTARYEAERCLHCGNKKAVYRKKENALYFNRACQNCRNCISVCQENAVTFEYSTV